MDPLARTPEPPYYAVVFTSVRTDADPDGYEQMAERMVELSAAQPGFLGIESARGTDGVGITVSYWDSEENIRRWRNHEQHAATRERGKREWYEHFEVRVAKVERAYAGP